MKTIVIILILLAFLEAAMLPIKLVLTILLVRAFVRQDSANLILAFGLGLLLSHLQNQPLGLNALIFLILVEAVYLWSKTTFSHNLWTAFPVIGIFLFVAEFVTDKHYANIIWELLLVPLIYLSVRFWEERFIVRRETKLKL